MKSIQKPDMKDQSLNLAELRLVPACSKLTSYKCRRKEKYQGERSFVGCVKKLTEMAANHKGTRVFTMEIRKH